MGWGSLNVGLWGLEWRALRRQFVIMLKHQPLKEPKLPGENFEGWEYLEDLHFAGGGRELLKVERIVSMTPCWYLLPGED